MAKILGIDLGTTNSAMAMVIDGQGQIIENREGARTTPSVVALAKNNEILVGITAKRQQITNPHNTIFSAKRLVGRRYTDPTVQRDIKLMPFEIREGSDGSVEVKMGEKWYKPFEIQAMILQKLKQDAETKLGFEIKEAIITCPAYFDDDQRKATKLAGEIAGFDVKRVINEPTAAALAYGLTKKENQTIVVYDFGGGTFDISILEIGDDVVEVKATNGDTHLGGDDFDQRIIDWLVDQFKKDNGIDLTKDPLALQRLKEAGEKAKIELSTTLETEINLPFITSNASGPKHLFYKINRSQLEDMVKDYIDRSIELVKQTLQDAKLQASDIDDIILVGGQTRMPKMQEEVRNLFNKEARKDVNPDEVVAIGASVQGGILQGEVRDVLLLDVTPLSLGIETLGGVNTILITKNTTVPTSKNQVFSTAADSQTSVEIHVLQGERPMAADNKSLGRFILDGIPPAPRGIPQVEVSFDIDANGILNVTAKDKATAKTQSIRIEGSCGVSKEEVEKMKQAAQMNASEDQKKKDLIEARNNADALIYSAQKTLNDFKDKVGENDKKEIEAKIDELKKAKDGDNMETIKQVSDSLMSVLQKIGSQLYSQQQQNPEPKKDDQGNVSDADFKEKQ
ncbi:MAG: molecular chaperone DnaK [Candidatus Pacebacteria bacterium]|nr:molecular chaperone DnaK [Candidatus Paceibacterota bacterium]